MLLGVPRSGTTSDGIMVRHVLGLRRNGSLIAPRFPRPQGMAAARCMVHEPGGRSSCEQDCPGQMPEREHLPPWHTAAATAGLGFIAAARLVANGQAGEQLGSLKDPPEGPSHLLSLTLE